MWFWAIVAGVITLMLLLSWRHDRKRRGSVRGDMKHQINVSDGANHAKDQRAIRAVTNGIQQMPGPR